MKHLSLFAFLAILSSCGSAPEPEDRFQLTTSPQGQVYRLDKQSGRMDSVRGNQILPLNDISTESADKLTKAKSWEERELKDKTKVRLKTRWRSGSLYFILTALPYTQELHDARQKQGATRGYQITFKDKDGFEIVQFLIPLDKMKIVLDEKGRPAALRANKNMAMDWETYEALEEWFVLYL